MTYEERHIEEELQEKTKMSLSSRVGLRLPRPVKDRGALACTLDTSTCNWRLESRQSIEIYGDRSCVKKLKPKGERDLWTGQVAHCQSLHV
jgi:hypothetical protein